MASESESEEDERRQNHGWQEHGKKWRVSGNWWRACFFKNPGLLTGLM